MNVRVLKLVVLSVCHSLPNYMQKIRQQQFKSILLGIYMCSYSSIAHYMYSWGCVEYKYISAIKSS
jgi:hypothetical protein